MSKPNLATEELVLVTDATRKGIGARADFVGRRQEGEADSLVFKCACGCGGHVAVDRVKMERLEAYRLAWLSRAKAKRIETPCFGGLAYVSGHEPMGIVGDSVRTGVRTQLRASA